MDLSKIQMIVSARKRSQHLISADMTYMHIRVAARNPHVPAKSLKTAGPRNEEPRSTGKRLETAPAALLRNPVLDNYTNSLATTFISRRLVT